MIGWGQRQGIVKRGPSVTPDRRTLVAEVGTRAHDSASDGVWPGHVAGPEIFAFAAHRRAWGVLTGGVATSEAIVDAR